jgi:hypothetical protein
LPLAAALGSAPVDAAGSVVDVAGSVAPVVVVPASADVVAVSVDAVVDEDVSAPVAAAAALP